MALRNILKDNDPGLLKKSREVTDFNKRLHILLDDMRDTLIEANGLGLAAPQVGVLRRAVLVVRTPDEPAGEPEPCQETEQETAAAAQPGETSETEELYGAEQSEPEANPEEGPGIEQPEPEIIELINPVLLFEEGEQTGSEGCLSLPGVYGMVKRPQTVKVKAQDRYGQPLELEAAGMTARAVCHEIDHLNGIIFTSIAERLLSDEEIEEMRNQREEEVNPPTAGGT